MRVETLEILCSPREHAPLALETRPAHNGDATEFLVNREHGLEFPIHEGIPVFVDKQAIDGLNGRFRRIYDSWAPFYDLLSRVGLAILGVSEQKLRRDFVDRLEIRNGSHVLSTSVGTGSDLSFIPRDCKFYGNDLSAGMLRVCQGRLNRLGLLAELFLGQAEYLPFKDEAFDVVYQMGGINFFSDQAQAIREMVRVAKKGTKIVIMDETEKVAKTLENVPGINAWFRHHRRPIVPPVDYIPSGMAEVETCELYDGQAWLISFRKPH